MKIVARLLKWERPNKARGDEQSSRRPNPPLEKILHPATKEKLFRHGNKEEGEQPREQSAPDRRDEGMEMEKAEE